MSKRIMPTAGFYVYKPDILASKGYKEVIYTTGVRGGGGHKYCRCFGAIFVNGNDATMEWATLLWSCVPSQAELDKSYTFYPTFDEIPKELGFPPLPT